ncbi:hypothetical protein Aduo_017772 [Ancylostoma duodenale]
MEPFSRKNSLKAVIYVRLKPKGLKGLNRPDNFQRSLRIPKKPKPPKPTVPKERSVFLIKQASFDNLHVLKPIQEERTTPMFPTKPTRVLPCTLIKFIDEADAKTYDKDCRLTSFERKRR